MTSFKLHLPNANPAEFSPSVMKYDQFLGSWHVISTTLPLWKDKKNVVITYSALKGKPSSTFDDLVSYNKLTDAVGVAPSEIKGVDVLESGTGAAWKWRGKGWLTPITSKWQLLGYNVVEQPNSTEQSEWVITYFSSTLFTPAGIDIYSRGSKALSDEFVESLVKGIIELGGEMKELAGDGKMFRVAHDV